MKNKNPILKEEENSPKVGEFKYLSVTVVDDDFAGALLEDNPGNGTLPAAGADDGLGCKTSGKSGFD